MLYFHDHGEEAYCPSCGWEYETALRESSIEVSPRERRRRRDLFPVDLSHESFFLDGSEYDYQSVREVVFWFTSRPTPFFGRSIRVNTRSHEYLLAFRAGNRPISLKRIERAGGPRSVLSTGEAYFTQVYRAIREKSFGARVEQRKHEIITTGQAVFGKLILTQGRTFRLGRRDGTLAEYSLELHGSDLCAVRHGERRPKTCVPSRRLPDLDVALAIIKAFRTREE